MSSPVSNDALGLRRIAFFKSDHMAKLYTIPISGMYHSEPSMDTPFRTFKGYTFQNLQWIHPSEPSKDTPFRTFNGYTLQNLQRIHPSEPSMDTPFRTFNGYTLQNLQWIHPSEPSMNTPVRTFNGYTLQNLQWIHPSEPSMDTPFRTFNGYNLQNLQWIHPCNILGKDIEPVDVNDVTSRHGLLRDIIRSSMFVTFINTLFLHYQSLFSYYIGDED